MLTFSANATDELCEIPNMQPEAESQSSFEIALANLSGFLSSTNPQARHRDAHEPLSRRVYRERISNLPQLEDAQKYNYAPASVYSGPGDYSDGAYEVPTETKMQGIQLFRPNEGKDRLVRPESVIESQPQQAPRAQPLAKPIYEQDMKLSPSTKRLLGRLPSGVGTVNSPKKNIVIDRFTMPADKNATDSNFEDVGNDNNNRKFEISMSKKGSDRSYERLGQALKALSVGQYESAIALYRMVLKNNSKNQDALFGLATAYHKAGQKTQARSAYASLLSYYPNHAAGMNNLLVLASEEAPQDALVELEILQKKNPDFSSIYAQKANIYVKLGDEESAIRNLAKALKLSPEDNAYKYNLAVMLDRVGNIEFSSKLYSELLRASYAGEQIPVGRNVIEERLTYIASLKQ